MLSVIEFPITDTLDFELEVDSGLLLLPICWIEIEVVASTDAVVLVFPYTFNVLDKFKNDEVLSNVLNF